MKRAKHDPLLTGGIGIIPGSAMASYSRDGQIAADHSHHMQQALQDQGKPGKKGDQQDTNHEHD